MCLCELDFVMDVLDIIVYIILRTCHGNYVWTLGYLLGPMSIF